MRQLFILIFVGTTSHQDNVNNDVHVLYFNSRFINNNQEIRNCQSALCQHEQQCMHILYVCNVQGSAQYGRKWSATIIIQPFSITTRITTTHKGVDINTSDVLQSYSD